MEEVLKKSVLHLTGLELFFISATVVSIFFNVWQFLGARSHRKALMAPVSNDLIAMFNSIKSEQNNVFYTQQLLARQDNPNTDIRTLKWEYTQYLQANLSFLEGLKELLVGCLVTINPGDKQGASTFRAADYGLTADEKERRRKFIESWQPPQRPGGTS